jgi:hypothetical protein
MGRGFSGNYVQQWGSDFERTHSRFLQDACLDSWGLSLLGTQEGPILFTSTAPDGAERTENIHLQLPPEMAMFLRDFLFRE